MDNFVNKREIKPEKYEIIELNNYSDFFTLIAIQVFIILFFCGYASVLLKIFYSVNAEEIFQFISKGFIFGLSILFFFIFLFIIITIFTWIKDKIRILDVNEYELAISDIKKLYKNEKISYNKMIKTADSLKKSHDKFLRVREERENNIKNLEKNYSYYKSKGEQ